MAIFLKNICVSNSKPLFGLTFKRFFNYFCLEFFVIFSSFDGIFINIGRMNELRMEGDFLQKELIKTQSLINLQPPE